MATNLTTDEKRHAIEFRVEGMIQEIAENMAKKLDKVLKSSAIGIDDYDPDYSGMVLPKAIICAILEDEADQYSLAHLPAFKKEFNSEKRNIKLII